MDTLSVVMKFARQIDESALESVGYDMMSLPMTPSRAVRSVVAKDLLSAMVKLARKKTTSPRQMAQATALCPTR